MNDIGVEIDVLPQKPQLFAGSGAGEEWNGHVDVSPGRHQAARKSTLTWSGVRIGFLVLGLPRPRFAGMAGGLMLKSSAASASTALRNILAGFAEYQPTSGPRSCARRGCRRSTDHAP